MLQLSWFVNKIKLLIGLIKHRAPGMGCLSAGIAHGPTQPDGCCAQGSSSSMQTRARQQPKRGSAPKNHCLRPPDLHMKAWRGPSSCPETEPALPLSLLSPSCWPRQEMATGPGHAMGTSGLPQSCFFLFGSTASWKSPQQCPNCVHPLQLHQQILCSPLPRHRSLP